MTVSGRKFSKHFQFSGEAMIRGAKSKAPTIILHAYKGKPMVPQGFSIPVVVDLAGCKFRHNRSPIIQDHETSLRLGHTTRQVILQVGQTARAKQGPISGPLVYAEGTPSSGMGVSKGFVQDASNGFPFQVSIGADILEAFFVEEGERSEVINGRRWKGPLIVASKTSIDELSVTVLGADRDTSATLAARRGNSSREIESMNFQSWLKAKGFVLSKLTAKQKASLKASYEAERKAAKDAKTKTAGKTTVTASDGKPRRRVAASKSRTVPSRIAASRRKAEVNTEDYLDRIAAGVANETERQSRIRELCLQFEDEVDTVRAGSKEVKLATFRKNALTDRSVTPEHVELTLMRAAMPKPGDVSGATPFIHMAQQVRDLPNEVLACALTRNFNKVPASKEHEWSGEKYGYEHWYPEKVLEASSHKDLRNLTFHQLMDIQIAATGGYWHGNRKSDEFIKESRKALIKANASGPSTMNLSTIFEDSAKKIMLAAFNLVNSTWQEIAQTRTVTDFKTHNMYRMTTAGAYRLVGVDGQLEHGGWSEEKFTHGADTYGKIVGLDRKHLINDDMGVFQSIMTELGNEAAVTMEELVYVLFLGSLTTLFPTDNSNGNYISGATSNVSITGLTQMVPRFENRVDADGRPILTPADRILVGTQDRVIAGQLFKNNSIVPAQSTTVDRFTDNPHVGAYRPIVTPFLNNTAIKQRVSKINQGASIPGQSGTQWFMFQNPNSAQGAALLVSLLNGNRQPTLEQADAPFDVLGLRWRAFHDFGVDLGDYRFAAMSKGAA